MGMKQEATFKEAKLDEVKKLIDDGYEGVDVGEDWEWNKGPRPGARHVVLNDILKNPQGNKFRDRTVFVCAAGNRSAIASEMAVAQGTKDVVNFRGGTGAWRWTNHERSSSRHHRGST